MAVTRLPHAGGSQDFVTLPRPLASPDAAHLRRILALIRAGDLPGASRETGLLADTTLLGDVLAERYLSPAAHPDPGQLRLWLKTFSDLPDAPAIYQLLSSVSPRGTRLPPAPDAATLGTESPTMPLPEEADPVTHAFTRNALLDRTVQLRLDSGAKGAISALSLVAATPHLDPLYAAQLRAEIALRLFTEGEDRRALETGRAAFEGSGRRNGLAGYVAGLAAWRHGHPEQALPLFEAASRAGLTSASIRAGAAFWAARAHQRTGDMTHYRPWLQRAASAPRTFYGLIATRLLGRPNHDWPADAGTAARPSASGNAVRLAALDLTEGSQAGSQAGGAPILSEIDVEAVAANPAGRRAFALLQIGETARAEATLRRLWPSVQGDMALCRSIQLVAQEAGLTALSEQLAAILQNRDGQPRDAARFPIPSLSPRHGFTVNPALVYALARIESNFDSHAVSGAGATGLMQLMPVTAGFVAGTPDRFTANSAALHNAGLNLDLGQRYLAYLARSSGVHDDLVRLLASYNAGPNAVLRWDGNGDTEHDPLLYIESLKLDETRDYVHRSFAYLWIYAARLQLASPSLDALAYGNWPRFSDETGVRSASVH
jgi:soluble lytic murein transglycosylase